MPCSGREDRGGALCRASVNACYLTSICPHPYRILRLCADSETNVQNAVQFLDNAVKDIVTSNAEVWARLCVFKANACDRYHLSYSVTLPTPHTPPHLPHLTHRHTFQAFNIVAFIPKLREYLRVQNPQKRQFLISWITVGDQQDGVSQGEDGSGNIMLSQASLAVLS